MKGPQTYKLMQEPEFQERVIELKNSGEYDSWKEISEVIKKEFNQEVSINALINTYRKTNAMAITTEGPAQKNFTHLIDSLKGRFERMVQRTEILSKAFDQLIDELEANPDFSASEKARYKLKLVDDLEKLNKIFIKQMEVVMDEIDKIKIEQSKLIYDEAQIVQKINESLPHLLKDLEDKGKIAIIDYDLVDN